MCFTNKLWKVFNFSSFANVVVAKNKKQVASFANVVAIVDEAHCIVNWLVI